MVIRIEMINKKNVPPLPVRKKEISNVKQADGFTLIELIIVMVILAVVTAVSIPKLGSIFESTSFRRMVNKAIAFLRDARVDALSTGKKISILVDLEEGKLTRLAEGEGDKNLQMPAGVELGIEQEGKLKRVQTFGEDENVEFAFYPNGTASGPKLFLEDTNRGRNAVIYLEPLAGHVRYKIGVFDKQD